MSDRLTRYGRLLTPSFVRQRYAAQFAIAFLAVMIVIAGVGGMTYVQAEETVERSTTQQLEETSKLQGESIGSWVAEMRTSTRSVSSGEPLQSDRTAAAHILLQDQLLSEDIVSMHYVNTSQNRVVASTELPIEDRSLDEVDAPWTDAEVPEGPGENSRVWQSDRSYRSPVLNDRPVMAFASSVPQRPNSYVVVVSRIQPQLERIQGENTDQRTTIVNENGETVLDIDRTVSTTEHAQQFGAIRNGTVNGTTTRIGTDRVYAYATVPGTDWVAMTDIETSTAFAVRNDVAQSVGLLVVLGLLSLGVVGVVLGKRTISPLTRLRSRAEQMEAGDLDVDLDTGREDEIGRLYDSFDAMRNSLRRRITEAEEALEEAEQSRSEAESAREEAEAAKQQAEAVSQQLKEQAAAYSDVMRAVADGDLTRRMDLDTDQEAMVEIATEFNAMIDQLESTVGSVMAFAEEVATASEEVSSGAGEIETTSQTVAERIQQISDGALRQNETLEETAGDMNNLSASIEEVASASATVANTAGETAERGKEGREAARSAIDDMAEIESRSDAAVEQMLELQSQMDEIGKVVDFITDIAEQTNLLALNANIEAAHADGSGEGFNVVADEVKNLAEETKTAAEQIETQIDELQNATDETVTDIRTTRDQISNGVETVREVSSTLQEIVDAIEDTNQGVQDISTTTDEQADATQRVVSQVDEVTEISQEVTESAEQVSAAAEEQTASVAEIASSAATLNERATTLADSLDAFTVDDESETDGRD
ncbi:methyl-accepting chemotaxis protein [Halomicrobium sp. IBSBa]|uniref:methyl-accepting chemotaxis protein n=1 Tax=Halomicrobium sp. IBSBa TaxID=2778916 RepID=UPI001ABF2562|nr:methyl-accepting chemotaxis protein [Halomicrobium sp. IBSBa]MBO4247833.1 methyl-accepting chemotaxis protein [Halomicrobium sp. IBSBa]